VSTLRGARGLGANNPSVSSAALAFASANQRALADAGLPNVTTPAE
jgi:hypothetical protein